MYFVNPNTLLMCILKKIIIFLCQDTSALTPSAPTTSAPATSAPNVYRESLNNIENLT